MLPPPLSLQTAFNVVLGLELIDLGIWAGKGVLGPEAFPAAPFMERMESYGFPYGVRDMTATPAPGPAAGVKVPVPAAAAGGAGKA